MSTVRFTPNSCADINGASFVELVKDMNIFDVQRKFHDGICDGYYDPEAGYEQDEVLFTRDDGVNLYVYDRYGQARFGCTKDLSKEEISEFLNYLRS